MQSLKASILAHTATFFESRGVVFDKAGYETQASTNLDDVSREMMFFGANSFPVQEDAIQIKPLTAAA
ncbi:hypothetical protein [Pararhizobium qamdonense]|uniref:hypothetical protein n=1 Tax=Pararhizobium qamdonense TaxID=3031126 RepID=UPI0023E2BC4E|nr:hypothetical protein [Pararhizobium qamdonense]